MFSMVRKNKVFPQRNIYLKITLDYFLIYQKKFNLNLNKYEQVL